MLKNITAQELLDILKADPDQIELIDVREADEYKLIHIKNAKLIIGSTLAVRLDEIDWTKKVVFYCYSGARSRLAGNFAVNMTGQDAYNLEGGIVDLYLKADKEIFKVEGNKDDIMGYL
jgi:rhodanese-related sulfurtransferase